MVSNDITRLPVRLVQEDGNAIDLDVTGMDIAVERSSSQIPVPFRDGQRFGIDFNMPQISIAFTGVLADDEGTNVPAEGPKAEMDFGSSVFSPSASTATVQGFPLPGRGGNNINLGGGGGGTVGAWLSLEPFGVTDSFAAVNSVNDLVNKYFDVPISYLASDSANALGRPTSPVTGMQLHLKADSISTSTVRVSNWADDSINNNDAVQSNPAFQPYYRANMWNGYPAVEFINSASIGMLIQSPVNLNPDNYTCFVVYSASSASGAQGPIIGNKGSGNSGYNLRYRSGGNGTTQFRAYQAATTQDVSTVGSVTASNNAPNLVTFQVSGASGSQVMTIREEGKLSTDSDTSLTLVKNPTAEDWQIGNDVDDSASDYFGGHIAEIIFYNTALSSTDVDKVEGYLAGKYNISLDEDHIYYDSPTQNATSIRVFCDIFKKGSKKEPHYFLNKTRTTDLVVDTYSASTGVVTVSSGNPLSWFDDPSGFVLAKDGSSKAFGAVSATTSTTVTVNTAGYTGPAPSNGDTLFILQSGTFNSRHYPDNQPVISIPAKDLFSPETLYADNTRRDLLTASNPAELFASRVKAALESSDSLGTLPLIASGETNAGGALSLKLLQGANGFLTRVEIEQKRKAAGLNGAVNIVSTLVARNERPVIQHFTGGRAGNNIKSAGDKAQDLLGILNNSQNFFKGNSNTSAAPPTAWVLADALSGVWSTLFDGGGQRDYIYGVQIPYLSSVNRTQTQVTDNPEITGTAVASGSTTTVTSFSAPHGLSVGDRVEITTENGLFAGITTTLIGTHTVTSVTSDTVFVINKDSSANVDGSGLNINIICSFKASFEDHNVPYVQRNFFLTVGDTSTEQKTSVANITPAKTPFNIEQTGHRRSGIQIAVDQFNVNFDADNRLYEFDLTMLAVDYLL